MNSLLKIKLVSYFCFAYAILQLISVFGLLTGGENSEIIRVIINIVIWSYLGYGLLKRRNKWDYWFAIIFLGILVLRGLSVVAITGVAGLSSAFLKSMSSELILGLIVFVLAITSLILLASKDVRKMFGAPQSSSS